MHVPRLPCDLPVRWNGGVADDRYGMVISACITGIRRRGLQRVGSGKQGGPGGLVEVGNRWY